MSGSGSKIPDFYRGDTVSWQLEFSDPETGNSIDITGHVFTVTLKVSADDDDVDAALQEEQTAPAGSPSTEGTIVLTLPATSTANLVPGKTYQMDIQRVNPNVSPSEVLTLHAQAIKVLRDVTHDS